MNVQFYATKEDFGALLGFAWNALKGRFFEDYSGFDQDLRSFETLDALLAYMNEPAKGSKSMCFCLEGCLHLPVLRRIELRRSTGGKFRYTLDGWGLIRFQFNDVSQPPPRESSVSVNSRARARKWEDTHPSLGPVDAWDWAAIDRNARRIERHVRKTLVAHARGARLMLPGAAATMGMKGSA